LFINLLEVAIEAIAGLFGATLRLKRLQIKRPQPERAEPNLAAAGIVLLLIVIFLLGLIGYHTLWHRKVIVLAEDGSRAPLARFIVELGAEEIHLRTKVNGQLKLPRFGVKGLQVVDLRYERQAWTGADIPSKLVLRRSQSSKALDALVRKLSKSDKENLPP
jgi:hypothetical protein